jgi:aminomethyltransferase
MPLLETPLHSWHAQRGARMVDFGGWSMPVQYTSIVDEHQACRQRAALFDVSHMGRFRFDGDAAEKFLDGLCTRKIVDTPLGKVRYSLLCREDGGILDDVLVYHLTDDLGPYYWMVVNASNRAKIAAWIEKHLPAAPGVKFADHTQYTAMIAVQGPAALAIAQSLSDVELLGLNYYTAEVGAFGGEPAMISRTGYTGEDGVEVTVAANAAQIVWSFLMEAGMQHSIVPAGLGARDTLRLEAAMPLYGHELSESITPVQAGLGFAISMKDRQFIGRDAIAKQQANPQLPQRIGLEMEGKRVPREHFGVFAREERVGEVTSGTYSPTLDRTIAMAYVAPSSAAVGTQLSIDIRGRREPARVVELPFYKREI